VSPSLQRLPASLEDGDLLLRLWRPEDAEVLAAAVTASIEHLRPWMQWIEHEPMAIEDRRMLIAHWHQRWEEASPVPLGIFLDGAVAGGSGYVRRSEDTLEIGYWVHVDLVRRGVATRAARLLTTAAFTVPGITRVEIHHDKANEASGAVPRRLGFRLAGERPDEPKAPAEVGIDCTWVMTEDAWPPG
jgi:ribosomal-protein-serine acetyltransferase